MHYLLFLSLRSMTYTPSLILDKLPLDKTPLNLGWWLKYLVISILFKRWGKTKNLYSYDPYYYMFFMFSWIFFLLSWVLFQLAMKIIIVLLTEEIQPLAIFLTLFLTLSLTPFASTFPIHEEAIGAISEAATGANKAIRSPPSRFFYFMFYCFSNSIIY